MMPSTRTPMPKLAVADMPDDPVNPDARVMLIFHLMVSGEFRRGDTAHALAARWTLPVSTVKNYTGQAARLVRLVGDAESYAGLARARLAQIIMDPNQKPRDTIAACQAVFASYRAINIQATDEVTKKLNELAALPPEQQLAEFDRLVESLIETEGTTDESTPG